MISLQSILNKMKQLLGKHLPEEETEEEEDHSNSKQYETLQIQ